MQTIQSVALIGMGAIVMDDAGLPTTRACTLAERLERIVYLSDGLPVAKCVAGVRLF